MNIIMHLHDGAWVAEVVSDGHSAVINTPFLEAMTKDEIIREIESCNPGMLVTIGDYYPLKP